MLYMVTERYRAGATDAIYARFRERGRQLPTGLHYINSWVDLKSTLCFQLMRTDDPRLFQPWIDAWSDLVEFEITPVQSSAEAAAASAERGRGPKGDRTRVSTFVRPVQPDDLEGVLRLYRELRPNDPALDPATARDVFAHLIQRDDIELLVCESNGVLTATCQLALIPNLANGARAFGVIEHVVTLSQYRRLGYARLLLERALELAWTRGCCKVVLLSGAQRAEAHKLYEAVGFVGGVESGFVARPPNAR